MKTKSEFDSMEDFSKDLWLKYREKLLNFTIKEIQNFTLKDEERLYQDMLDNEYNIYSLIIIGNKLVKDRIECKSSNGYLVTNFNFKNTDNIYNVRYSSDDYMFFEKNPKVPDVLLKVSFK